MEQVISEIIVEINPFDEFNIDTDLFGEGILDSLSLIVLIEEIEKKLCITILEEDITIENFYSIRTIIKLLDSKK